MNDYEIPLKRTVSILETTETKKKTSNNLEVFFFSFTFAEKGELNTSQKLEKDQTLANCLQISIVKLLKTQLNY